MKAWRNTSSNKTKQYTSQTIWETFFEHNKAQTNGGARETFLCRLLIMSSRVEMKCYLFLSHTIYVVLLKWYMWHGCCGRAAVVTIVDFSFASVFVWRIYIINNSVWFHFIHSHVSTHTRLLFLDCIELAFLIYSNAMNNTHSRTSTHTCHNSWSMKYLALKMGHICCTQVNYKAEVNLIMLFVYSKT